MTIMRRTGVEVELVRAIDHEIATGVWPDMTEHGWARDDWPAIFETVIAADILVLMTPIWLGEKSSVCTQVIERLYGNSHLLNDAGQYAYYGRVGGCLVTGNEDGIKHCAMNVLYSLQHLGYTIPPQADAGWIGEAGPGPSYLDEGSGGPRERLHQPQHHVHDLEPAARRAHAQGRRRHPRATATSARVGRRHALRSRQPGAPAYACNGSGGRETTSRPPTLRPLGGPHMSRFTPHRGRFVLGATVALAVLAGPAAAGAMADPGAVYTQTNDPAGNVVQAFDRDARGELTPAGTFSTGGAGLAALGGRQGAVELSDDESTVYAVNARLELGLGVRRRARAGSRWRTSRARAASPRPASTSTTAACTCSTRAARRT